MRDTKSRRLRGRLWQRTTASAQAGPYQEAAGRTIPTRTNTVGVVGSRCQTAEARDAGWPMSLVCSRSLKEDRPIPRLRGRAEEGGPICRPDASRPSSARRCRSGAVRKGRPGPLPRGCDRGSPTAGRRPDVNYPVGYPPFPVEVSTDHTFQRRAARAAYPFRWACRFGENTRLPWRRGASVGWSLSPRERLAETPVVRSTNTLPSNACGVGQNSPRTSSGNHPVPLSVRVAEMGSLPPGVRRFCGRHCTHKPTRILPRVCYGKPTPFFSRGGLHLQPNRLTETTVVVRARGRNARPLGGPHYIGLVGRPTTTAEMDLRAYLIAL